MFIYYLSRGKKKLKYPQVTLHSIYEDFVFPFLLAPFCHFHSLLMNFFRGNVQSTELLGLSMLIQCLHLVSLGCFQEKIGRWFSQVHVPCENKVVVRGKTCWHSQELFVLEGGWPRDALGCKISRVVSIPNCYGFLQATSKHCKTEIMIIFIEHFLYTMSSDKDFYLSICLLCSVQFSRSVMSDSLWRHEPQHARPPSPSPTPGVYSNSCPSSRWCHPTISCSVVPFSCLQYFPASGSFQMSQLLPSGGQNIGVWASTSVLPMNTQDWSPLGWTGWISLQSKGLSRVFSNTTVQKHQFFDAQLFLQSNYHIYTWPLEKP